MSQEAAANAPQNDRPDLPDGVVDAAPATGWESAEVADAETDERSRAESAKAGLPEDAASGYDVAAADDVESAEITQGIDPDLASDDADDEGER
ncbi:hypothetical protein [Microbacterium dextranolyticum]|uniref:Uncharacterized protein n=1 Tax=Microbacterium dextranolyticum TaxID=36806 RepID=A0A9W6M5R1_9MICO|nr:hypothetical protein [Microbacterium dextranolyticum]MBM7463993.1 hypothetical protein [Microbacterium dextranolyticum]GLJ95072.1 hypothetical protein GCM10017591_11340 [Microbacterium dextranolyticum]